MSIPGGFVAGTPLTAAELNAIGATVGYDVTTSDFTGFTAVADVTGLSQSFTASNTRRYKISWGCPFPTSTVAGDRVRTTVTDGSNNILGLAQVVVNTASTTTSSVFGATIRNDLDGAVTVKLRAQISGSGTGTLSAAAATPNWLLIEDIGPA